MTTRPRLTRSIPFWALVAGSAASVGVGAWLVSDKISVMTSALTDGTATGVEVYAGQSWAVLGAALVAAGLVGFVAALALAAARSLVAPQAVEVVEAIAWQDDDVDVATPEADPRPVAEAATAAPETTADEAPATR